jgi:hypothetical protein
MTKIIITIFYYVLFYLFLSGAVIIVLSFKRSGDISGLTKKVLIAVFFMHCLIYMLAGMVHITLGWQRNFFYLLPGFFLALFYFLKKITSRKIYYYTASGVILIPFLCVNIHNSFSWERNNVLRETARLAGNIELHSVIVYRNPIDIALFEYYIKKYDARDKTLLLYAHATRTECTNVLRALNNVDKFMVLQSSRGNFLSEPMSKVLLDEGLFEMVDKKEYAIETGPYLFLRKLIGNPRQYITVYSYQKTIHKK